MGSFADYLDNKELRQCLESGLNDDLKNRARLERATVARPSEYFLGGVPAIGTCPGRHWAVHSWPTAHQSPYYRLFLGQRPEQVRSLVHH